MSGHQVTTLFYFVYITGKSHNASWIFGGTATEETLSPGHRNSITSHCWYCTSSQFLTEMNYRPSKLHLLNVSTTCIFKINIGITYSILYRHYMRLYMIYYIIYVYIIMYGTGRRPATPPPTPHGIPPPGLPPGGRGGGALAIHLIDTL